MVGCLSYGSGSVVVFRVWLLPINVCFRGISHVVLCKQQRVGKEGFGDCSAEIITVGEMASPATNSVLWS